MRPILKEYTTQTAGLGEQQAFTIDMNGLAFETLIAGLYSRKEESILREILTNAYDAHIAAGTTDQPIQISWGFQLQPELRIRDFGTGMDHPTVMRLYSRLFASTKRDTDEQVGMLGLGSKSPFAYTNSFTVTSWHDGQKTIYGVYRTEGGVPSIALVSQTSTDEPNGVEIQFPILNKDLTAWKRAFERVKFGFPSSMLPGTRPIPSLTGTNWEVYDSVDLEGVYARQGCVLYKIDPISLGYTGYRPHAIFGRFGVVIDFPIGTLPPTPNREGLQYLGSTILTLKEAIEAVTKSIWETLQAEIEAFPTYVDACEFYAKVINRGYGYTTPSAKEELWLIGAFGDNHTWRGRKVAHRFTWSTPGLVDYIEDRRLASSQLRFNDKRRGQIQINAADMSKYTFVVDRETNSSGTRMKALIEDLAPKRVVWIRTTNPEPVLKEFGHPNYVELSDYEPTPSTRVVKKGDIYQAKTLESLNYQSLDASKGGVYVRLTDHFVIVGSQRWQEDNLRSLYSNLYHANVLRDQSVWVFNGTHRAIPTKYKSWVELTDYLKALPVDAQDAINYEHERSAVGGPIVFYLLCHRSVLEKYIPKYYKVHDENTKMNSARHENYKRYEFINQFFPIGAGLTSVEPKFVKVHIDLLTKYPLLTAVCDYPHTTPIEHVLDYIRSKA